jgi:hypothetical protein
MKRLGLIAAFVALLSLGGAQAQFITLGNQGVVASGGGGSFTGPGDVVTAASFGYWSCARAYNAAFAATQGAMCTVVDTATGASSCTLKVGTNGLANLTALVCVGNTVSITTFCTVTHSGCSVTEMFDQTGGGNPQLQATLASMPTLTLSAQNGLPGVTFTQANSQFMETAAIAAALQQPLTVSWVGKTAGVGGSALFGNTDSQFFNAATTFLFDGASSATVALAASTNFAVLDLFNSPSGAATSAIFANGTALSTTLTLSGDGTEGNGDPFQVGCGNGCSNFFGGTIYEIMAWDSNQSANAAALSANQRNATTGYNF